MSRLWAQVRELLRGQTRNILVWGFSMGLLGALYMALFPSMGKLIQGYLDALPAAYLQFLGMQAGMGTPQGWLAMEMFNMVGPIALPFFTILLGARAVAGAEERGRLDILLSNPVPALAAGGRPSSWPWPPGWRGSSCCSSPSPGWRPWWREWTWDRAP